MDSLAVQQVTTLLINARANLLVEVDPETEDTTQLLNSKIQQAYFWVSQAIHLIESDALSVVEVCDGNTKTKTSQPPYQGGTD